MVAIAAARQRLGLALYVSRLALKDPGRIPGAIARRRRRALLARVRAAFRQPYYLKLNARRLEHLESLGLPLAGRTVLEVGAGIGDLTSYFTDRGCRVVVTDSRDENLAVIRDEQPEVDVALLDLDHPDPSFDLNAEVVFCYGVLYHLARPAEALAYLRARCTGMLMLETWVSPGDGEHLNRVSETRTRWTQAQGGVGCRPTRAWVFRELQRLFPHVYATATQPWGGDFPLDWTAPPETPYTRAVFVASVDPLENSLLVDHLLDRQRRP